MGLYHPHLSVREFASGDESTEVTRAKYSFSLERKAGRLYWCFSNSVSPSLQTSGLDNIVSPELEPKADPSNIEAIREARQLL
jgi:hypothetical protein